MTDRLPDSRLCCPVDGCGHVHSIDDIKNCHVCGLAADTRDWSVVPVPLPFPSRPARRRYVNSTMHYHTVVCGPRCREILMKNWLRYALCRS